MRVIARISCMVGKEYAKSNLLPNDFKLYYEFFVDISAAI